MKEVIEEMVAKGYEGVQLTKKKRNHNHHVVVV
jgi:hypothetical protein